MSRRFFLSAFFAAAPMLLALGFLTNGTEPANACACCGTYQVVGVDYDDVLNVRSGPGVQYKIVSALPPGTGCVIRTGPRRGNWVKISYPDAKGWVNKRFLKWKK